MQRSIQYTICLQICLHRVDKIRTQKRAAAGVLQSLESRIAIHSPSLNLLIRKGHALFNVSMRKVTIILAKPRSPLLWSISYEITTKKRYREAQVADILRIPILIHFFFNHKRLHQAPSSFLLGNILSIL